MNKFDRVLLNKVNVFLAECYENRTLISSKNLGTMFCKIFNNDITYMDLCPNGLEDSLRTLVSDINSNLNQIDTFKDSLKIYLVAYYNTIYYELKKSQGLVSRELDKHWLKAFWSEYVLETLLYKDSDSENFKNEYAQLGILIQRFYTEEDSQKSPYIKSMIISKLTDMYKRFDYKFDLPALSITA